MEIEESKNLIEIKFGELQAFLGGSWVKVVVRELWEGNRTNPTSQVLHEDERNKR